MAASQPPTENLPAFNSGVFKDANTSALTLSQANLLFLARTGTPNSQATSTIFTGSLSANSATITNDLTLTSGAIKNTQSNNVSIGNTCLNLNNYNPSVPTSYINNIAISNYGALASLTSSVLNNFSRDNVAIGYKALFTNDIQSYNVAIGSGALENSKSGGCTAVGYQAGNSLSSFGDITAVGYNAGFGVVDETGNTAIGYGAYSTGNYANSTAIGDATVITGAKATALGKGASAGANQVVLGTATETVICPGTASNISLVATKSITVNGNILVGTKGTGLRNTILGNLAGDALTNQTGNTFIGYAAGVAYAGAAGANNTIIGNSAGASLTAGTENVIIGRNAVFNSAPENTSASKITVIGANSTITTGVINATSIGYDTRLTGNNAVAIGYQASAGANQVVLGTATESVICPGTTNNTSLQLSRGLVLQSTYGTIASTMLGYQISLTAVAFTNTQIDSGTCVLGSIVLTPGVWAINYSVELNVDFTLTISEQTYYFTDQSNGGSYPSQAIANTGTVGIFHNISYTGGDLPTISGGGCLYTSSGRTIYPSFALTKTGGDISATGWANATRIG